MARRRGGGFLICERRAARGRVDAVLVNSRVRRCTNKGDSERAIEVGERWSDLFLGERGGDMRMPADIVGVDRGGGTRREQLLLM